MSGRVNVSPHTTCKCISPDPRPCKLREDHHHGSCVFPGNAGSGRRLVVGAARKQCPALRSVHGSAFSLRDGLREGRHHRLQLVLDQRKGRPRRSGVFLVGITFIATTPDELCGGSRCGPTTVFVTNIVVSRDERLFVWSRFERRVAKYHFIGPTAKDCVVGRIFLDKVVWTSRRMEITCLVAPIGRDRYDS